MSDQRYEGRLELTSARAEAHQRHDGVVGTSFRTFPSYPQRFIERLDTQPVCDGELARVEVEPWRGAARRGAYTEADLHTRQFFHDASRRLLQKKEPRAAA